VRLAFDTNVLVYAEGVERAREDGAKHRLAVRLVDRCAGETLVLSRQALAELHTVLVRKAGVAATDASRRVRLWAGKAISIDTDAGVFEAALSLAASHKLQIFDAIILAAAVEARCDLLLSEDLQDGFAWRGVAVTNPFGVAPDAQIARLIAS
jgi:predicted nucleic acid-binding protein